MARRDNRRDDRRPDDKHKSGDRDKYKSDRDKYHRNGDRKYYDKDKVHFVDEDDQAKDGEDDQSDDSGRSSRHSDVGNDSADDAYVAIAFIDRQLTCYKCHKTFDSQPQTRAHARKCSPFRAAQNAGHQDGITN